MQQYYLCENPILPYIIIVLNFNLINISWRIQYLLQPFIMKVFFYGYARRLLVIFETTWVGMHQGDRNVKNPNEINISCYWRFKDTSHSNPKSGSNDSNQCISSMTHMSITEHLQNPLMWVRVTQNKQRLTKLVKWTQVFFSVYFHAFIWISQYF